MDPITLGNIEITALNDWEGPFYPADQLFPAVSASQWEPYRQRFPETFADSTRAYSRFGVYLLRLGHTTILVDTGIGPEPSPVLQGGHGHLLAEHAGQHLHPEEIDIVFLTHAHADHVGWNIAPNGRPTFPKARYIMSTSEWEAAHRPDALALFGPCIQQSVTPLKDLGVLELLTGEQAITAECRTLPTPGHTSGHTSLLVSAGEQQILVGGDAFSTPAQITENDWVIVNDMQPVQATETRKWLAEKMHRERIVSAWSHFPGTGIGHIVAQSGHLYWQPLEAGTELKRALPPESRVRSV